ncbi:hypothetical protein [Actinocorallia populi]|uniref:hypothetical protein n=1 Tax=Actinocorallia populi TaxID=2079200 RepID=UPI000D08EBE7|nr:hypothetical protein [Actinocorallia populi]
MKLDKLQDKDLPEEAAAEEAGSEPAEEVVEGQLSLMETEEAEETGEAEGSEDPEGSAEPEEPEGAEASGEGTAEAEDAEESEKDAEAAQDDDGEAGEAEEAEAGAAAASKKKASKAGKPKKKALRPARVRRDAPLWSVIVMAVAVIGLAAGTFVLRAGSGETLTRDEVDKAVRTAAATAQHISSWDYRTIESDTKQVLGETTGDFREAYEKSAVKLLESAPEQEAVTVGLTSKAGVESVSKGQVKVLVFLNQQTTRKDADAHIEQHRLLLTMVEKDGEWLVSKLDILG